jgi:SAM-dependent methyltransferase
VAPGTWAYIHERSIADHYDAFVADTPLCRTDQAVLADAFPRLDAPASQAVVDLGCGSGRTAIDLSDRGYAVIGVDLSQSMLEVLRRKLAQRPADSRIHTVRANLVQLGGLATDSCDHAVCMFSTLGMIQGRAHRRTLLSHVRRLVKTPGRFVVHVHHRWAALSEPNGTRKLARSWWRSLCSADHEFGDTIYAYRGIQQMFMHRFSLRELKTDLAATGWSINAIHCLSADGASVISRPMLRRHQIGGFIVECGPVSASR